MRNTLRIANYKRQVEATIATLRATDINGAPLTPATPLSALVVTRNHDGGRTRDNDDDAFVNQTELVSKFDAWGMRHTLLAGLELGKEELHRWNYALDANPNLAGVQVPTSITSFLSPDPYTQLSYTKTPNVRARAEADTVAVYVQDQFDIAPTWKALLGLRWEDYDSEARTENYLTGAPATGPFGRKDEMLSGRAGLIWQPNARQSYYIAAGNSYNPSGELGVYGGTGTNLSDINEDLEPEENRNYELGAQWDFAYGLQLRASLFRTEKINARMADPVLGTTVLAGKRRVDGLELQLTGRITPEWDVYSGLAFMDGEIVTGPATVQGKVPLGVPDVSGSLWTVYRLPRDFEVGGGLRYSSGFWLNDANTGEVPSYTVWDCDRGLRAGEVRGAAERQQHHRQDLLRRRLQQQPEPRASGRPAQRLDHVALPFHLMLLHVPSVLDAGQVAHFRARLADAPWVDGNVTSGHQSAQCQVQRAGARGLRGRARAGRDGAGGARAQPAVLLRGLAQAGVPAAVQPLRAGHDLRQPRRQRHPHPRSEPHAHPHRPVGDAVPGRARRVRRRRTRRRGHSAARTASSCPPGTWCCTRQRACTASRRSRAARASARSSGSRAWCATMRSARCCSTSTCRSCA